MRVSCLSLLRVVRLESNLSLSRDDWDLSLQEAVSHHKQLELQLDLNEVVIALLEKRVASFPKPEREVPDPAGEPAPGVY